VRDLIAEDHRPLWPGVEVRHLATLAAVARARSFREAASALGYAPSVTTHHVGELERAVGVGLVARRNGRRTVELTAAGRLLLSRGATISGRLAAAQHDIAALERPSDPCMRVAVATGAEALLGRVVPAMLERHPDVRLHVIEVADPAEPALQIERGAADVGIGAPPVRPAVAGAELACDPFLVLARCDSPLARLPAVERPEQLAGETLIVLASAPPEASLDLERAIRVPVAGTLQPLVAAGLGVALVPASAVPHLEAELAAVPAELAAPRRTAVCWHAARGSDPLATTLRAVAA